MLLNAGAVTVNNCLVEIVARMGIEARQLQQENPAISDDVLLDRLFSMAKIEFNARQKRKQNSKRFRDLSDWFSNVNINGVAFCFAMINKRLEVVKVRTTDNVKLIDWGVGLIPLVALE